MTYLVLIGGIATALVIYGVRYSSLGLRSSTAVLSGLKVRSGSAPDEVFLRDSRDGFSLDHPLAVYGCFTREERSLWKRMQWGIPLVFGILGGLIGTIMGSTRISLMASLGGFSLALLLWGRFQRKKKEDLKRNIEFFLPVIMERLVIAVHAGLDVIPAVGSVIKVDHFRKKQEELGAQGGSILPLDPVSRLLGYAYVLTEAGMSFERALQRIVEKVESTPLRHAFLHLALAYKEGGELVAPLRELSDATQLYYQESTEEEIARLPVKATLPLLLTFTGLLLFFLASPLSQILMFLTRAHSSLPQ